MNEFLKKLQSDLEEGKKTDFADKFKSILEQAEKVDTKKTQEKVDNIDFVALGLAGTEEQVEESKVKHAEFIKALSAEEEKELAKANVLFLQQEVVTMKLAILETEKKIREQVKAYEAKYSESIE